MVRRIQKVTKSVPTKIRRKIVVVGTEGKNKTEELYLRYLERTQTEYHFIFAQGNDTDPVNIVKNTIKKAKEEDLSYKDGDLAISVFDLDIDESKKLQLNMAKELCETKRVGLITSNPCFEVWYLEHFGFTTKAFLNGTELINELKKYLPDYSKNKVDFDILYPLTENAVTNCRRLDEYHRNGGVEDICEFNNPRTDVYKIVEKIKHLESE